MAIGTTSALDPTTGERTESQFNYTPVDPQEDLMRQAFQQSQQAFYPPPPQPQGPTPYWENPQTYYPQQRPIDPIAQAKAATMAAQKFIAFRGYQQDLKDGIAAADAFAKWGPMLVQDTSFGPSVRALRPPQQGKWIPPNPQTGQPGFYQEPTQYGSRANYPTAGSVPSTWVEANPKTGEPAHWSKAGSVEQVRTSTKGNEITPTQALNIVSDPYKWQFAQSALGPDATNLVNIAKGGLPKAAQATPASQSTAPPSIGEVRKGYKFKGGNPALADNWQKVM